MDVFWLLDTKALLSLLFLLLLTYAYLSWPYNYFKNLGVPGPSPLPMFGVWKDLKTKGMPQIDDDLITKYGKVFGFYEGWQTALMAADPELIKEVAIKLSHHFVDRREFLLRGITKHSVFDATGAKWKRLRSLSTPFFTSGKLKRNSKRISHVLSHVMEFLEEKSSEKAEIEAKQFSSKITMDVICSAVFGIDANTVMKEEHPLTVNSKASVSDFSPQNPWFLMWLFLPAIARVFDYFDVSMFRKKPLDYTANLCKTLIQEREHGNQDAEIFVTALLKAHEEELDYESKQTLGVTENITHKGMSEAEILSQALIFVLAGYDTTATALSFLLHALTMNPDIQQNLYEEITVTLDEQPVTYDNVQKLEYLSWCVDETLRLYSPVVRTDRRCTHDSVTVAGIPLKKGHLVVFPIWYLHHQPDVWPDPYKFDPLRFSPEVKDGRHPYYFLPFGIGPRNCIGMRLALLEIKMATVAILQKFRLVPNSKTVPVELDLKALFTTAKDGLWFSVEKRD